MLHGFAVCVWGLFAILTPVPGREGWVVDGTGFGVVLLIVGVILILQGVIGRGPRKGTWPFILAGGVMLATGAAAIILGALDRPVAILWSVFGYLLVDGLILTLGTLPRPAYRFWGALSGAPMFVAALGILLLWTFFPGYDVMDTVFGALGVFYGICVVTASVLARSGELRGAPIV